MYACLGVTCHLHYWQNGMGLLRTTAVTRGWNGHRIRVSTQSKLWRRKFSRRDSNSQPFDHESGAVTSKLSRLPKLIRSWHQTHSSLWPRESGSDPIALPAILSSHSCIKRAFCIKVRSERDAHVTSAAERHHILSKQRR